MGFYLVAHQTHAPPAPCSAAPTLHLPCSATQARSLGAVLLPPLALSGAQARSLRACLVPFSIQLGQLQPARLRLARLNAFNADCLVVCMRSARLG
jgi:hypothetical protein